MPEVEISQEEPTDARLGVPGPRTRQMITLQSTSKRDELRIVRDDVLPRRPISQRVLAN